MQVAGYPLVAATDSSLESQQGHDIAGNDVFYSI